jgi:hypothetical protein
MASRDVECDTGTSQRFIDRSPEEGNSLPSVAEL